MNLELHNSWEYEDGDWWNWAAYLTGPDLPKVDYVEYILHPTFKKPLREVRDADGGFRMETAGWGTFDLKAVVHLKDGSKQLLTREIKLETKPRIGRTDG